MDITEMYELAEDAYPQPGVVNENRPLSQEDLELAEQLAQRLAKTLSEN